MQWVVLVSLVLGVLLSGRTRTTLAQEYELVFEDNFDTLDLDKWDYEVTAWGSGNSEFQVYTPDAENSYVRDGYLYLKPTLLEENINPLTGEPFGPEFLVNGVLDLEAMYGTCTMDANAGCYRTAQENGIQPIMSARLRTYQRFSFKYGRMELRARMPRGDWLWPAMWLLPEYWVYGNWPASGEVDIVEVIGNSDLVCNGEQKGMKHMGATLHWGASASENRFYLTATGKDNNTHSFSEHMHDFVVTWDETGFSYEIDGQFLVKFPDPDHQPWEGWGEFGAPWDVSGHHPWGDSTSAPFSEEFHFLLNVAAGGTNGFIPDGCVNGGAQKPWTNGDGWKDAMQKFYDDRGNWGPTWVGEEAAMQVDYVRVYQRTEQPEDLFVTVSDSDCPGDDLEDELYVNQDECLYMCSTREDCQAVLYIKDPDYQFGRCYLKSQMCTCPIPDSGIDMFTRVASDFCTYTYRSGDCIGNDIYSAQISLEECRVECDSRTECLTFTYDMRDAAQFCYLLSDTCDETLPEDGMHTYEKVLV